MAEITEVLQKLIQRTKEGKVPWKPTADEQTFVAVIGTNSAMIFSRGSGYNELKILNGAGAEIEAVNDLSNDVALKSDLNELHRQARRIALAVGETLAELLEELEKVE